MICLPIKRDIPNQFVGPFCFQVQSIVSALELEICTGSEHDVPTPVAMASVIVQLPKLHVIDNEMKPSIKQSQQYRGFTLAFPRLNKAFNWYKLLGSYVPCSPVAISHPPGAHPTTTNQQAPGAHASTPFLSFASPLQASATIHGVGSTSRGRGRRWRRCAQLGTRRRRTWTWGRRWSREKGKQKSRTRWEGLDLRAWSTGSVGWNSPPQWVSYDYREVGNWACVCRGHETNLFSPPHFMQKLLLCWCVTLINMHDNPMTLPLRLAWYTRFIWRHASLIDWHELQT